METKMIDSIDKFMEMFLDLHKNPEKGADYIFRGVSRASYKLESSLGRYAKVYAEAGMLSEEIRSSLFGLERAMFSNFQRLGNKYLVEKNIPVGGKNFDMDLMLIAQHHGLPTRLLDWTFNPFVALFFSVQDYKYHKEKPDAENGAVFAILVNSVFTRTGVESLMEQNEEETEYIVGDKFVAFAPQYIDERIAAQMGLFTIFPIPEKELEDANDVIGGKKTVKYEISAEIKYEALRMLASMGITARTLFPGLDGEAQHVKDEANVIVKSDIESYQKK